MSGSFSLQRLKSKTEKEGTPCKGVVRLTRPSFSIVLLELTEPSYFISAVDSIFY